MKETLSGPGGGHTTIHRGCHVHGGRLHCSTDHDKQDRLKTQGDIYRREKISPWLGTLPYTGAVKCMRVGSGELKQDRLKTQGDL